MKTLTSFTKRNIKLFFKEGLFSFIYFCICHLILLLLYLEKIVNHLNS